MSTLPFLLSVADELDNINSQNYLDDFGLGFHPHRQYYRTPSIQLSLPASTDWMQERHRCRTHKFIDETQNNLQEGPEDVEDAETDNNTSGETSESATNPGNTAAKYGEMNYSSGSATSGSTGHQHQHQHQHQHHRYPNCRASNSNNEDDNIDNAVQMYKLSKKCCKSNQCPGPIDAGKVSHGSDKSSGDSYRLHTKCMEANNSSSEESLQKVPSSSIEFLTCFLVKKSRGPKHAAGERSGKKS